MVIHLECTMLFITKTQITIDDRHLQNQPHLQHIPYVPFSSAILCYSETVTKELV